MVSITDDTIDDEEWFYRTFPIPDNRTGKLEIHGRIIDGQLRLERGLWRDRNFQPSVDRKKLVQSMRDIAHNKNGATDAVIQIQAKEIREISGNILSADERSYREHNVIFDPLEIRPAHALITTTPFFEEKSNSEKKKWKEFQRYLSLAAEKHGWTLIESES